MYKTNKINLIPYILFICAVALIVNLTSCAGSYASKAGAITNQLANVFFKDKKHINFKN